MPATDLPALEHRLEACLIELERLYEARPRMSDVLAGAGAGQRIDELLDEIAEATAGDHAEPGRDAPGRGCEAQATPQRLPGGPGARAATGGSAGGR